MSRGHIRVQGHPLSLDLTEWKQSRFTHCLLRGRAFPAALEYWGILEKQERKADICCCPHTKQHSLFCQWNQKCHYFYLKKRPCERSTSRTCLFSHTPIESNSIPPEWDGFHPEWTGSYTVLPAELWAQAFIQQVHPLIPFLTFTLLWMQTLGVWILPKGFWQPGVDSTFWATATPLIQFLKKAVWHALNLSNLIWYQYLQYGQVSLHWQCYFSQS